MTCERDVQVFGSSEGHTEVVTLGRNCHFYPMQPVSFNFSKCIKMRYSRWT